MKYETDKWNEMKTNMKTKQLHSIPPPHLSTSSWIWNIQVYSYTTTPLANPHRWWDTSTWISKGLFPSPDIWVSVSVQVSAYGVQVDEVPKNIVLTLLSVAQ